MISPPAGRFLKALALLAALVLTLAACVRAPSPEEVKSWMQVTDVSTKWVSKAYQPWPPKLTLVPSVTFRVKNVSSSPLTYVDFNAIFRFKGETQNLGDNYKAAILGTAVQPGELSAPITLTSNYGVEGKTLASFENNPAWRPVEVRLFAQSHGSRPVLLGEYDVSREIDFKEPPPVGQEKPGEGKEEKK
jgi:hypothetical protein